MCPLFLCPIINITKLYAFINVKCVIFDGIIKTTQNKTKNHETVYNYCRPCQVQLFTYFLNYLFYAVLGLTDSHVTEANEAASRGDDVLMLPLILGHLLMGVISGSGIFKMGQRYT